MKNITETHTSNFVSNDDYNHVRGVPMLAVLASRMISRQYLIGVLHHESAYADLLNIENQKKTLKEDVGTLSSNMHFAAYAAFIGLLGSFLMYILSVDIFDFWGTATNKWVRFVGFLFGLLMIASIVVYYLLADGRKFVLSQLQNMHKSWPDTDRLRSFDWACELLGAHLDNHLLKVIPEPDRLELTWSDRAHGLRWRGVFYLSSLCTQDQLDTIRAGLVALAYTIIEQDKRGPNNPISVRGKFSEIMDLLKDFELISKVFPDGSNTVDSAWGIVFKKADELYNKNRQKGKPELMPLA